MRWMLMPGAQAELEPVAGGAPVQLTHSLACRHAPFCSWPVLLIGGPVPNDVAGFGPTVCRHIPFRGSKLTEVLRDSFIGEGRKLLGLANVGCSAQWANTWLVSC